MTTEKDLSTLEFHRRIRIVVLSGQTETHHDPSKFLVARSLSSTLSILNRNVVPLLGIPRTMMGLSISMPSMRRGTPSPTLTLCER